MNLGDRIDRPRNLYWWFEPFLRSLKPTFLEGIYE